jgi:N-methylhydantoinase B
MIAEQILYDRLLAATRELAETVGRTVRSPLLAEQRHYAVGLLSADLRLAAQLQFAPGATYLIRASARALVDYFAYDLGEGDLLVSGDPFSGGSTAQTLTFLLPVFHDGEAALFAAVRAEMLDLAGDLPGPLNPRADEIWQEAIRITPIKLYRHGVLQRDMARFLGRNSRAIGLLRSDIAAIVAALRLSARRLEHLLADHGREAIGAAIDSGIDRTSRRATELLSNIAQPSAPARIALPWSGAVEVAVEGTFEISAGTARLDLAGSSPAQAAPLNITRAHAAGFALAALLPGLFEASSLNDGVLEALAITAPVGSVVDARLPSATGLADFVTGPAIADLVATLTASRARLSGPAPALVLFAPLGHDEEPYILPLDPGFATGSSGWGPAFTAGHVQLPSAEILETQQGLRLVSRERRPDGAVSVEIANLRGALEAAAFVPAEPGAALSVAFEGETRSLTGAAGVPVPRGAVLHFTYPSYGAPADV